MKLAYDFDDAYVEIEASAPFLPYIKGEAARLELCALAAKRALGVAETAALDPWKATERVSIELRGAAYIDSFPDEIRAQVLGPGASRWSAGTIMSGERTAIVLNPEHSCERQKVTLAEELAHLVMGHPPCTIDPLTGFRTYYVDVEEEAFGVGGAMVLPYSHLFWLAKDGRPESEIATRFGVSVRFVSYRINRAGLRRMYRKRRRSITTGS
jgi:hypothetical protein